MATGSSQHDPHHHVHQQRVRLQAAAAFLHDSAPTRTSCRRLVSRGGRRPGAARRHGPWRQPGVASLQPAATGRASRHRRAGGAVADCRGRRWAPKPSRRAPSSARSPTAACATSRRSRRRRDSLARVARTIGELRLAGVAAAPWRISGPGGPDLATLLACIDRELADAGAADRTLLLASATDALDQPRGRRRGTGGRAAAAAHRPRARV